MKLLLTGANGFVGQNLRVHLARRPDIEVVALSHVDSDAAVADAARGAAFVCHLAGVNRPKDERDFTTGNDGFTARLIDAIVAGGRAPPLLYASSIQAERDNPYGRSKRAAEERIEAYGQAVGAATYIYRLPNVFGKWCRPNYNSAIATFCHNIARGLPIDVHDPAAPLALVYVDDVVEAFIAAFDRKAEPGRPTVAPVYNTTVGAVAEQIQAFAASRTSLVSERVGAGLTRALHATYLSYLPRESFAYAVPCHADPRGQFVEMLKTRDSGQFSFFTAKPGVTRGGHFHHSKSEKFLVVKGRARFGFRQIVSGETFELETSSDHPMIVETVPGWSHDITNIGDDEMIVLLWANEIFDRARPDTYAHAV